MTRKSLYMFSLCRHDFSPNISGAWLVESVDSRYEGQSSRESCGHPQHVDDIQSHVESLGVVAHT
jgi:hypothetical protein